MSIDAGAYYGMGGTARNIWEKLATPITFLALVDELVLYIAPVLFGAGARPLSDIATVGSIEAAPRFHFCEQRRFGADLRVILKPGLGPATAGAE